jgi:hypothetical protein
MEKHVTLVGVLHAGFSLMGLLAAGIVFLAIGGGGFLSGDPEAMWITGTVAVAIASFLAVLSLPGFIGGIGLLLRKSWARVLLLIVAVLGLLNIPFGTALGIYTLWVLTKPEASAYLRGAGPPPVTPGRVVI